MEGISASSVSLLDGSVTIRSRPPPPVRRQRLEGSLEVQFSIQLIT